tara:strand:- start:1865 stop:2176 length:312 start_codon:yes stop_codon:yes gene_type:complete
MNKFVELTEVRDAGGFYDPKKEKICAHYTLKKIHVNISHITRIEENYEFKEKTQKEELISGLNSALASFSTITLGAQPNYDRVLVIGEPNIILAKLREASDGK